MPAGLERVEQLRGERRLARAVDAFDRDQPAAVHARGSDPTAGTTIEAVLAELERHPHARAVLASGAGGRRPRVARVPVLRPGGAGKRVGGPRDRRRAAGRGLAAIPRARARAVASGAHPDLTWVAPSGAHEILVSDIDGPVVAAASKTPFEASCRVFVIERVDELGDEAANRMLKTLEEPASFVHLILLTDRLAEVLPTIRSRCQLVRFDAPSMRGDRGRARGARRGGRDRAGLRAAGARRRRAGARAGRERGAGAARGGRALRARGACGRGGARRAVADVLAAVRARAARRLAPSSRPGGGGARAVPAQGAQAGRDRVDRADPAGPATGRDRGARSRAAGGGALVRRPRLPGLGRPTIWFATSIASTSCEADSEVVGPGSVCARRSSWWRTRACVCSSTCPRSWPAKRSRTGWSDCWRPYDADAARVPAPAGALGSARSSSR